MLDLNEIKAHLSGPLKVLPDLSMRLLHYEAYRMFSAPNEFGGSIVQQTIFLKDGVMKGIGCSPGEFIGREYGIPAILNLSNATKSIKDGDLISMNGKTAQVVVLEESSQGQTKISGD